MTDMDDELTLTQKIEALKDSPLRDEQRLQVLIDLTAKLSLKVDRVLDKLFLDAQGTRR